MYQIKARYYTQSDCFGESYVITSDNEGVDTKFDIGEDVLLLPGDTVEYRTSKTKESNNRAQHQKAEIAKLISKYSNPEKGAVIDARKVIVDLQQLSAIL